MPNKIAVVSYDCQTSAGQTLEDTWGTLSAGGSGIRPIDRYSPDAETLQGVSAISYGGQIPLSFSDMAGSADRFTKWSEPNYHAIRWLTRSVLKKIDFDISRHVPQRIAFLGGTALNSQIARETLNRTHKADSKYILHQCHNVPLAVAASEVGIQGPCFSIGSACASSGHAILLASQLIHSGLLDCALIVGHEFPLMPHSVGGLEWLKALYRRDEPNDRAFADPGQASRPFSQDRRGFVLAEGAGAVFLSDESYAQAMGWPVQARILGAFANSDADHLTRISPRNIARCMESALAAAKCNAEDIDCVNAHATSTPLGDQSELTALREVLGERLERVPVVANKSQICHSLGASSVLGLILAMEGMARGVLLPTLNHIPDPSLPAAFIPTAAMAYDHHRTLLNSFGFGGTNFSMVVEGRNDTDARH